MSQQRLKDPYTSGTMLAFGIQAKLVKAIYIISWMSSWLPRPRQQPAIIFPKMHLCIFFQTEFCKCSLHLGMWMTMICQLPARTVLGRAPSRVMERRCLRWRSGAEQSRHHAGDPGAFHVGDRAHLIVLLRRMGGWSQEAVQIRSQTRELDISDFGLWMQQTLGQDLSNSAASGEL